MLERQKAMENLKRARRTPRCVHIKQDGVQCGSPALKHDGMCFAHARLAMRHPKLLAMPLLEDANSVQAAIMEVMRGLLDGDIDRKTAGLLLYGLQMAVCNLKNVCFEPKDRKSVVRDVSTIQPYCDFDDDCEDGLERNAGAEHQDEVTAPVTASSEASSLSPDHKPLQPSASAEQEQSQIHQDVSDSRPDYTQQHCDPPSSETAPPHNDHIKSAGEMLTALSEMHRLAEKVVHAEKHGFRN